MLSQKVAVELILGHRASLRERPTPEGFTHDWEVYVKGDRGDIQNFVDRVIFHLHESFPKHRRGKFGILSERYLCCHYYPLCVHS